MKRPPTFLHPFSRPAATDFVRIVRGEGALVFDDAGRDYVDGMAGLWYTAVGHGRREMADAIAHQAATLAAYSCFDPFTNDPADALAERIATSFTVPDARIFFCSAGSEAVDSAIKLARLTHARRGEPQRTLIISRQRAYHGVTYGGTSAQGLPLNKEGFGPLVGDVVQVPADDLEALATLMAERSEQIAAVLAEPVQGAGGVFPPQEGYLAGLRRLCDRHGALLIFDEVITGFGRLGTWSGAEHFGVVPDMVTFAKAVTSGYIPLGGVVIGRAVSNALEADASFLLRHGFTYSGHPTACAAGLASMTIIERESLMARAVTMGARLGEGLQSIAADGQIAEARGAVAVWAIGLRPDQDAVVVRNKMLDLGVITRAIGADTNTFCPPLVITDAQLDRLLDAVATATR
jgi:putrescine---pyruvate transaminase